MMEHLLVFGTVALALLGHFDLATFLIACATYVRFYTLTSDMDEEE